MPTEVKADSSERRKKIEARIDRLWEAAEKKSDSAKMAICVTSELKLLELEMRRNGEFMTDSARRAEEIAKGLAEARPELACGRIPHPL